MRVLSALCAALLLISPLSAGEIKGERTVPAYKLVRLESDIKPAADKEGKPTTRYSWVVDGVDNNGKATEADTYKTGNQLIFTGAPGTYKIRLTVVDFDSRTFDEANCVVTISGDSPGPSPGPKPDPDDAFTKSVKAAWGREKQTAETREQMEFLSAIYTGSGSIVDASPTVGDLFTKLSDTIHKDGVGIPKGALPEVTKAVGAKLAADLGTSPATKLDPVKAKATLSSVGEALRKALGSAKKEER